MSALEVLLISCVPALVVFAACWRLNHAALDAVQSVFDYAKAIEGQNTVRLEAQQTLAALKEEGE